MVAFERDVLRCEPQPGKVLGIEEVGALQVRVEVLVLDVDAGDAGDALESRVAVVPDRERYGDVAELP